VGDISVPSSFRVLHRNTFDYSFNGALNPTLRLGRNAITFTPGLQYTLRRDRRSPIDMDQNLFRQFVYMSTSAFGNWLTVHGAAMHEAGPFTLQNLHSRDYLARLRAGRSVAVFPEGRTGDGREIGPFHARIFLAAVETGAPVQPVALRYGARGAAQSVVAFQRGEHFLGNVLRLLGEPPRRADVIFLEPILPGASAGRRGIAELARDRIATAMHS
jgi:1-acyl-sn-glycerol-3-phosphate acyltransferase